VNESPYQALGSLWQPYWFLEWRRSWSRSYLEETNMAVSKP